MTHIHQYAAVQRSTDEDLAAHSDSSRVKIILFPFIGEEYSLHLVNDISFTTAVLHPEQERP